jgi:5-(carboxyamino)imidazole ribonucleotide mutase
MKSSQIPRVGIIMGSDSDLSIMQSAADRLSGFGIESEVTIVSAHRTPDRMMQYGLQAASRGLKVLIAGAGGAAHLPGMVASLTSLPVIGVPIRSRNSIEGIDSLFSIVQMPSGVPVATVGVDSADNAGLLAARILALEDVELGDQLEAFRQAQTEKVLAKAQSLESEFGNKKKEEH